MIDPARACIALAPLAVYLLVIGVLNLSRRPFVTTGTRDFLALGVGVSGLVMIGPVELLTSTPMVLALGPNYWLLVLGLYASGWLVIGLQLPPRLVVYNVSTERLRAALSEVARELDGESHWSGETLVLPEIGAQLLVEPFSAMRNASVASVGEPHSLALWRVLEAGLRQKFADAPVTRNASGLMLISAALLLIGGLVYQWILRPQEITRGIMQMLGVG